MKNHYKLLFLCLMILNGLGINAKNNETAIVEVLNKNILKTIPLAPITATISGTTTACLNSNAPILTLTASGGTAPYTFTYQINGGATQTVTTVATSSTAIINASTSVAGSFTYSLVSVHDAAAPTVEESVTGNVVVTITPTSAPDANLGGTGSGTNFNDVPAFRVCSNATSSIFTFTNASSTVATNTNYKIDWGDGSPVLDVPTWDNTTTQTHNYAIGLWNLTYTVQSGNGCSTVKKYIVFLGSNPGVSLGNPGNTDVCNSQALTFPITGTTNNPPGTTYTITFNDGSAPEVYNHPPPATVTHTFLKTSCGVNSTSGGGTTYNNSYSANIKAENPCGSSEVGVVPIYVSISPEADFTAPARECINKAVPLANTSKGSYETNNNSACNTSPKMVWSISPATGFTITTGTLGNDFGSTDPNIWLNGTENLSLNFTQPGTYTITLKAGNRCGFDTEVKTICIETPLAPQFTLNTATGCTPLAITTTNTTDTTNACTPPTYTWSVTHAQGFCSTTTATVPDQTTNNATYNFTEPGTYTIKLTTTNVCGTYETSKTVTVKKPPTASIAAIPNACGPVTINPTATINSCAPASSTLTYAWSFPGGTPATSNTAIPGAISYTTAGDYIISLSVTNECGTTIAANQTFSIKTPPTISGNLVSCVGFTSQLTGSGVAAATNPWASATATVATVNTTGLVTSVTAGTTDITFTDNNNCQATQTFTVNPAPTITQPISNTICQGGTLPALTFTVSGATSTPTYQWFSNTVNNTTTGVIIPGETNISYSPPSSTVGTTYYYCEITLPTGGCASIKTNTATIIIAPNATISTQPLATQNLCVGVTIPAALTFTYAGGTGTPSYQWFSNTTNSNTTGTAITGATTDTYTPPVFTTAGNYYYYAVVTPNGTGCLPVSTNVAAVIVYPDPTITTQPQATQNLCQGAAPTNLEVVAASGNGAFSYQWYSNTTDANTGGQLLTGATSSTYTPVTTAVGTLYYYCMVNQTSTPGCSVTSATAAVTVIAAPTINNQPVSSAICLGGTPSQLAVTYINGVGSPTYEWFSNSTNTISGATKIVGATNDTYTPPSATTGTTYYYSIITLPSTGGCSSITSTIASVAINSIPAIATQPIATQNTCVGGTISTPLTATYTGGSGTPTYQWYSNTTNTTTGGTAIATATSANFTPAAFTTTGKKYFYVEISFSNNGCGSAISNTAEIDVIADPIVTVQPLASQAVCQNTTPANLTFTVTGGIGATYFYQWYSNTANNNTSGTLITGATNNSYTPSTATVGTVYYYCQITQANGLDCNATTATSSVTVNLSPTIATQPLSNSYCIGQTVADLSIGFINGVGTPQYQWYSNTSDSTIGGTLLTGETSTTYSPSGSSVGTNYYYCTITLSTGGCSLLTSSVATITINQRPIIAPKTALIRSGQSFSITPNSLAADIVPTGTTYTWSAPTIVPAGTVTGASAQTVAQTAIGQTLTLTNTATSPAVVTYTVTPLSGTCTGTNFTVTVTVNPSVNPNISFQDSLCFGKNSGSIQTNISGGVPFSTGSPYLVSWTGPNGFTSTAASIFNLAPGDYALVITDAGGSPYNQTVTIAQQNDITIVTDLQKNIKCFNSRDGEIRVTASGGTPNYTYTWTRNGSAFATTKNIANLDIGTYVVSVSDANSCGPKTSTFVITQPTNLAVSLTNKTDLLCYNKPTGDITVSNSGGTAPYTYAWSGPNSYTSTDQNISNLLAGTYNLVVTDNIGCTNGLNVTLNQNTEIKITETTTPIKCHGDNNGTITIATTGGVAPYGIAWSNLATGTYQENLSGGNYDVTITDALNCEQRKSITIDTPPVFAISPVVKDIDCYGNKNGSIKLNFVGGVTPIKLVWNDNHIAGINRNNLLAGTYSVTITDSQPCKIAQTFTINEPQALALSSNLTHAFDCTDANSGAIDLIVAGGNTPFTYSWSNNATTEDLANIPAGNYWVTATDAKGCTKQKNFSINRQPEININVLTKTSFDCDNKNIKQTFEAQVSGGVPGYSLVWSSGTVSGPNNEFMNTNQDGTVNLLVTDAIGCTKTYSLNVKVPKLGSPSFQASSYANLNYGFYSINDPIEFTNTATDGFVAISWDFGDGVLSTELNPKHTYTRPREYTVTQKVTYPYGCVYEYKITINVEKGYVLTVPTAFTPNNDGLNDFFRPVTKALKNVQLDVYDSWGSLIYSEKGAEQALVGWNAQIKGLNAENGNYFCKVSGETFYGVTVHQDHPFVLIK